MDEGVNTRIGLRCFLVLFIIIIFFNVDIGTRLCLYVDKHLANYVFICL